MKPKSNFPPLGNCFPALVLLCLFDASANLFGAVWTQTTPQPGGGYQGHSLVYASGFLYQAGGSSALNGSADGTNVFYARVQDNGTIGAWTPTTSLPDPVLFHAGVAANGFVYVLGGIHVQTNGMEFASNIVYYAQIQSDGSIGSWLMANPLPKALMHLTGSAWSNTIYAVGGADRNYVENSNVYSAHLQSDGSLSAWTEQPALPIAVYIQAEAVNGIFYVLGGIVNNITMPTNTVYYSKINDDGTLTGWGQTTPLPQSNSAFGAVAAHGFVFSMGGGVFQSPNLVLTNAVYLASVTGDGSLGAWSVGTPLPQALNDFAVAASDSCIFVSGGEGTNHAQIVATVYSLPLPSPPVPPTLTCSNLAGGSFHLRLSSQTNRGFGLMASTNLADWINIGSGFTGTNGQMSFTDTNAPTHAQRFYRAYWPLP